MMQQAGRQISAAIAFRQDTEFLWAIGGECCGKEYRSFGWFNRHRRAKHR